jgi:hypothetical protein
LTPWNFDFVRKRPGGQGALGQTLIRLPPSHRRHDPRQAAVEHVSALVALAQEIIHEAVPRSPTRQTTPKRGYAAAAGRLAHRRRILTEIAELERDGKARTAASIVALRHAADKRDGIEVETLTNKYRRWRRAEKRACARSTSLQQVKVCK